MHESDRTDLAAAFRRLDEELAGTRAARPPHTAPWARARARRQRRIAATGGGIAFASVVAGATVGTDLLSLRESDRGAVFGTGTQVTPAPYPTPSTSPCADPTAYDLDFVEPFEKGHPLLFLSRGSGALDGLQLVASDLGAQWSEGGAGTLASAMPGVEDPENYIDVAARHLSTGQVQDRASWGLHQSALQVERGRGAEVWQAAVDRLLCTTAVHPVDVVSAGEEGVARWLAVRETVPTAVTDGDSPLRPGPSETGWRVLVARGDVLSTLRVDSWGHPDYVDTELPTSWVDGLARAAAARLQGRTPEPLPALQ